MKSTISLTVLIIVSLLNTFFVSAETLLFRSNPIGMSLEKISEYQRDDYPYVLELEREEGEERRRLYREGGLIEKTTREFSPRGLIKKERRFDNGNLVEVRNFSREGRVTEALHYSNGEISERIEYRYSDDVLIERRHYDDEDRLRSKIRFSYLKARRMRGLVHETDENKIEKQSYSYDDRGLYAERYRGEGESILSRFDLHGNLVLEEHYDGEGLLTREERSYRMVPDDEGHMLESLELFDSRTGKRTVRHYDDEARLVRREVYENGMRTEIEAFHYKDGLLSHKEHREPGISECWTYAYDEEERLVREEYRKNGGLRTVWLYPKEGKSIKEIYIDSEPVMKVYFENDYKLAEEIIKDGEVLRRRSWEN